MSQLAHYDQEPKVAGASCMYPSKEEERLKEENYRLTQKAKELERDKKKLEVENKSLSRAMNHFEETTGALNCKVDELTAKLQDSARYGVPLFIILLTVLIC